MLVESVQWTADLCCQVALTVYTFLIIIFAEQNYLDAIPAHNNHLCTVYCIFSRLILPFCHIFFKSSFRSPCIKVYILYTIYKNNEYIIYNVVFVICWPLYTVWADFAVCDLWSYCKVLCDVKFRKIEGNSQTFRHILKLSISVIS